METPQPKPTGPVPVVPVPRKPKPAPKSTSSEATAQLRGGGAKLKGPGLMLAAAAAVMLGFVVFGGGSNKSRVEVSPVVNADVSQAIDAMQIPDREKERLRQQANADQIELWQYTVLGSGGAASEVYSVSTDLATHTYTVGEQTQEFTLWTTKGSTSFTFDAVNDNKRPGMPGEWMTPKGAFSFDMQPGGALTIPVR